MTSLTQVAITARKSIRYIIFFIVFLTLGKILLGIGISVYLKVFPPAQASPTVKFGKLTAIPFPTNAPVAKLTFTLETPTGSFPTNIPAQAKVYFMPKVNPNLLSLDDAKSKAQLMGFNDPNPVAESDTLYKFTDPNFPTTLETNIVTGAFSISYDLASDRSPIANRPPASEIAATEFQAVLSTASDLPSDLTGPVVPEYYKLENGSLTKVLSLSEADVTKVSLFREPYDNLPSLTANPFQSNVWAMVGGAEQKDQQMIAAEYHYFPVDPTQYSTYPIITPQQAYSELQNNQEFIASLGQYKDGDTVTIRNVYLAYFDPNTPGDFYQPVYVFDSVETNHENSFVGYIPAVNPSYYSGH